MSQAISPHGGHGAEGPRNEAFNTWSHLIGMGLGLVGMAVLVGKSAAEGKSLHALAFGIYGATLSLLYFSSTFYHYTCWRGPVERLDKTQRLDHCAIYLLIAGSYTPICMLALPKPLGFILLGVIWALAAGGITYRLLAKKKNRLLSVGLYLVMSWMAVGGIVPLSKALDTTGLALLFGGGLAFTIGAVMYAMKKPDPKPGVFGHHEIWHLFVLTGSALHYCMMLFSVLPR